MSCCGTGQAEFQNARPTRAARRGVTLLELLIAITIIAIMASLLLPAIAAMRTASLRTACENNMRQLSLGLDMYLDALRPMFIAAPSPEQPSGWALAVLPFTEEGALLKRFNYHQPPTSAHNVEIAGYRPPLFLCPASDEPNSTLPGVGVTHYVLIIDNDAQRPYEWRHRQWAFRDAPKDSRFPWITSPEITWENANYPPPHESAAGLFGFE